MPQLEFHALNVSAHPHPAGIYHELFRRVAGKRVKYFGEKTAAISRPSDVNDGIFWGYIFTWTEIDKRLPFLDTLLLKEPDPEQLSKINIPDNIGINWQVFHYVFRVSDHVCVFESKNSEGGTLAPKNAEKIFRGMTDPKVLSKIKFDVRSPDYVEVDLLVERGQLDKFMNAPRISSLEIFISQPNPDDNFEDTEALIGHLKRVRARSQRIRVQVDRG